MRFVRTKIIVACFILAAFGASLFLYPGSTVSCLLSISVLTIFVLFLAELASSQRQIAYSLVAYGMLFSTCGEVIGAADSWRRFAAAATGDLKQDGKQDSAALCMIVLMSVRD